MSLTARQRATGGIPSTMDLPYRPLPARPEREDTPQPQSQQRDHVLRLSRLEPDAANEEPAGSEPNATEAQAAQQGDEDQAETSSELDVAAARGDSDDDVHFGGSNATLGVRLAATVSSPRSRASRSSRAQRMLSNVANTRAAWEATIFPAGVRLLPRTVRTTSRWPIAVSSVRRWIDAEG
jgi:hypothetical protein